MRKTIITIGTVAVVTLSGTIFTDTSVFADKTLQEVNKERQVIKTELSKAEKAIADVLYEIKDMNETIAKLDEELLDNQKQIDDIELVIDQTEDEITEVSNRIAERNEILKNRISSYQHSGGNISFLEVFMGASDFVELIGRVSAVTSITNSDAELMEEQQKDKEVLEQKLEEQEDLHVDLKEAEQAIEEKKSEQKIAKKSMEQKESELQEKKAKLKSKDNNLATLENNIRAEMARAAARTTVVSAPASSPANQDAAKNKTNTVKVAAEKTANPASFSGSSSAINAGMSVLGTPYRPAGKGPGGFDCSGFVAWAYGQAGKSIPSYTGALKNLGTAVSSSNAQPGDLVFFNTVGSNTHVGIYLGGGKFIAANTTRGVEIKNLSDPYWKDVFKGHVRRIN